MRVTNGLGPDYVYIVWEIQAILELFTMQDQKMETIELPVDDESYVRHMDGDRQICEFILKLGINRKGLIGVACILSGIWLLSRVDVASLYLCTPRRAYG